MTLIAMGPSPYVVASTVGQRQPLIQALDTLKPTDGQADLQDALQLAVASAGPKTSGTRLIIISDGITEPLTEPATLPFPVQYKRVGVSNENTAITALSVVPGVTGERATAHVQDFGQEPERVTAEMFADGQLTDAQSALVQGGGSQNLTFAVPPGTSYVRVVLVPSGDLRADDSAVAVASPPRKIRVLLVTKGDLFLQKALELRPDVTLTTEAPRSWQPAEASSPDVDLFVFDGFVPPALPAHSPYLVVGPPPDHQLGSGGPIVPGQLLPAEADNPLLYDVDLSNVDVAASADLQGSTFGTVVISSPAGPVLMLRNASPSAPPAAVLGIYLHDSDLVLRTAFPILVDHLSEFLAPSAVPAVSQSPGTPVTLAPGAGARAVLVTRPDGHIDVVGAGPVQLGGRRGDAPVHRHVRSGPVQSERLGAGRRSTRQLYSRQCAGHGHRPPTAARRDRGEGECLGQCSALPGPVDGHRCSRTGRSSPGVARLPPCPLVTVPINFSHPLWLTALLLAVPLILIWRHWPAAFPRRQRQAALARAPGPGRRHRPGPRRP